MSSVIVDQKLSSNLRRATGAVEVRDERGEVIGVFSPFFRSNEEFSRFVRRILPDPEAVRKQKQSDERTFTTDEVRAHLRSLGTN